MDLNKAKRQSNKKNARATNQFEHISHQAANKLTIAQTSRPKRREDDSGMRSARSRNMHTKCTLLWDHSFPEEPRIALHGRVRKGHAYSNLQMPIRSAPDKITITPWCSQRREYCNSSKKIARSLAPSLCKKYGGKDAAQNSRMEEWMGEGRGRRDGEDEGRRLAQWWRMNFDSG